MLKLINDLRYGLRQLVKHPLYSLIAVVTLALGIGANAAIFTVINAALFKPLPYADETRLVVLREYRTDDAQASRGVSYLNFSDWRAQSRSFETLALASLDTATLRAEGEPMRVDGAIVSADFFKTLGIAPQLGRAFEPGDEQRGASAGLNPVLLSHSGWQKHFGGDPKILGRQVTIDEQPYQVIGVTPPGIFPLATEPVDFWVTTAVNGNPADGETANGSRNFRTYPGVIARLKAGVSVTQAAADLAAIQTRLAQQYPKVMANRAVSVEPLRDLFVRDARGTLWLLLGMVGVVLLIACVNVANVLLARAATRQREIAIRTALGASRRDIVQQFLVESLLLALVASLAGFALGRVTLDAGIRAVYAALPLAVADHIRLLPVVPDARVLVALIAAGIGTAVLFGALPAFHATRHAGTIASHGATPDGRTSRLRHGLVVAQITVSALLIVTCGVLLRGSVRLATTDLGLQTRDVIEVRTRNQSNETALATLRAHPLVRTVAAASTSTFGGWFSAAISRVSCLKRWHDQDPRRTTPAGP